MKVYKNSTFKGVVDMSEMAVGESIVTRSDENHNEFQVHVQRIPGVYTPMGKFLDLKTAVHFAEKLDVATMISKGYQIIELDHEQKMIVYYGMYEHEIEQYIDNTKQIISDEAYKIGESGINVCFIRPKENELLETNRDHKRDEMVWFGQYLLSDARRKLFESHPVFGKENLEERLKQVHHSDYENYKVWRQTRFDLYDLKINEDDEVMKVRNEYRGETKDRDYEMRVLFEMKTICEESLSAKSFESFEKIVDELVKNRKDLKGN